MFNVNIKCGFHIYLCGNYVYGIGRVEMKVLICFGILYLQGFYNFVKKFGSVIF